MRPRPANPTRPASATANEPPAPDLPDRARRLLDAQDQALELLAAITHKELIRPGVSELQASHDIHDLAEDLFGVEKHWHKRVVRAGLNTLEPYSINPPERTIGEDDIAFIDLGPVFVDWEADVGRTYVFGDDPAKHAICNDLIPIFTSAQSYFEQTPDITGAQLYAHVTELAVAAGWEYGGPIVGHLVGEFPHDKIAGNDIHCYAHPDNHTPMRDHPATDQGFYWILEIHLVDRVKQIGSFYEQLLNLSR